RSSSRFSRRGDIGRQEPQLTMHKRRLPIVGRSSNCSCALRRTGFGIPEHLRRPLGILDGSLVLAAAGLNLPKFKEGRGFMVLVSEFSPNLEGVVVVGSGLLVVKLLSGLL